MKKILNLLIIATITFGSIPNLIANNAYDLFFNKGTINLGFIKEANTETILKTLREKYPRVNFDEFDIEISGNSYCNNFSDDLCANLKIKENSLNYLKGLNQKIIFKVMEATNNYIEKRNVPSLLETAATINIGTININTKKNILECLLNSNNSLFSHPNFIHNFVFDEIGITSARGHLSQNIIVGERMIDVVPDNINFIINYTASSYTLETFIPNLDLSDLENNYEYTILERLQELNSRIISNNLHLGIWNITPNSASIICAKPFEQKINYGYNNVVVNFKTKNPSLSSLVLFNTDLGELPNNYASTIKEAFLGKNLNITKKDVLRVDNITNIKANIYGHLPLLRKNLIFFKDGSWLPNNNNIHNSQNYDPAKKWLFTDFVTVYFTLTEKKTNNKQSSIPVNEQYTSKSNSDLPPELPKPNLSKKQSIFNKIKKIITKKNKTNNSSEGKDKKNLLNSEYHFLNQINEQSSLEHNKNLDINLIENDNNFTKLTSTVNQVSENKIVNNLQNFENLLLENKFYNQNYEQNQKIVKQYNLISKKDKQLALTGISQYVQTLSDDEQKAFKEKMKAIGKETYATGINIKHNDKDPGVISSTLVSGGGLLGVSKLTGVSPIKSLTKATNYLKNMVSSPQISTTAASETVELTPLLSAEAAEELTVAETLTVEATATAVGEGSIIGTEAAVSASLAPETLGLSLVIGGLALVGTGLFYWIFGSNQANVVKHELHNQYNEIEKYYQFLTHDKLKLSIDSFKWKTISEIYQKYSSNYQEFVKKIREKITSFHKEDHSGWGGKLDDNDINILIKVLFDNFHIINNSFLRNSTHGWKIVTNTIGSYFSIEKE